MVNLNTYYPQITSEDIKAAFDTLQKQERLLQGVAAATNHLLTYRELKEAINLALADLGKAVEVDRVYIFENHILTSTGEMLMSQRYEWANEDNVTPQINNPELQNRPYKDVSFWYDVLSKGETIVGLVKDFPEDEREILEAQDIKSILVVPIFVNGKFWGYIGFDDCQAERIFTKNEEAILKTMAASIGGRIMHYIEEKKLLKLNEVSTKVVQMLPNLIFKCQKRNDSKYYLTYAEGAIAEEYEMKTSKVKDITLDNILSKTYANQAVEYLEKVARGDLEDFVIQDKGRVFIVKAKSLDIVEDLNCQAEVVGVVSEITSDWLSRSILKNIKQKEKFIPDINEHLTSREIDVLNLLREGKNNQQIADDLLISVSTVKNHLFSIYKKLGVSSRTELLVKSR